MLKHIYFYVIYVGKFKKKFNYKEIGKLKFTCTEPSKFFSTVVFNWAETASIFSFLRLIRPTETKPFWAYFTFYKPTKA